MTVFDGESWVCRAQEDITMGGGKGGGSSGNVTSTQTPPPEVMAQYKNVIAQANNVASNPLQLYQGQMVAPFTGMQNQAFDSINNAQGMATPYNMQATSNIQDSTTPIWNQVQQFSPQAIQQYMNPYTQQVVDSTRQNMAQTNAVNNQGLISKAIGSGAFGGDRAGIAQAEQNRTQSLADNQTIAGLYNQSYNSGLGAFQQQQGQQQQAAAQTAALNQQAAGLYSGLGNTAMNQALTGAQAQLGAGTLQQQLAQSQLNVPYQQYQQQMGYPFQTTQFLANTSLGLGSGMGGTSTTTQPSASGASQALGGIMGGIGLLGSTGAFGPTGWLFNRGGRVGYAPGGAVSPFDIPDMSQTFIPQSPMAMGQGALPQVPQAGQSGKESDMSGQMGMLAQLLKAKSPNSMPSREDMLKQDIGAEDQLTNNAGGMSGVFDRMGQSGYFDSPDMMSRIGSIFNLARGGPVGYAMGGPLTMDPNSPFAMSPMATTATQPGPGGFDTPLAEPGPVSVGAPDIQSYVPQQQMAPQNQPAPLAQGQMGAPPPPVPVQDQAESPVDSTSDEIGGKPDPWQALATAGFGMMAGTSPSFGTNFGRGALAGLANYQQQKSAELKAAKLMEEIEYRKALISKTGAQTDAIEQKNSTPGGNDPAHIREANALVKSGYAPDFSSAYDMVRSGVNDFKTWNQAVGKAKESVPLMDDKGNLIPDDQREQQAREVIANRQENMPNMSRTSAAAAKASAAPAAAINALKADPSLADEFDAYYGAGASKKYIK